VEKAKRDVPSGLVTTHTELQVHRLAFDAAMELFNCSRHFPREETYSLTDQIRRSSRSVCANLAEGWRRRRYRAAFVSKLNEAEAEAAETQTWIEFAVRCEYLNREVAAKLYGTYDEILGIIVAMVRDASRWTLK